MRRVMTMVKVAAVVAVGVVACAAALKDPFAGKWKVSAMPEGGAGKGFNDVLTFQGGKMTAATLSQKGWAPAEFEEDVRQGGVAQFKCTLKHATDGQMDWAGSVTAAEIRGTVNWKKGEEETKYNFSGSKN